MDQAKVISVLVSINRSPIPDFEIPTDINEISLKGYLRDAGFISSNQRSYATTRVYFRANKETEKEEICINKCRSISDLGITDGSIIIIEPGEPETQYKSYRNPGSRRCLYGCPMARSVEDAINSAEGYNESDSKITKGIIPD